MFADAGARLRHAVWAVPLGAQAAAWQMLASNLARRLDGWAVPAHLTVTSGLGPDPQPTVAVLDRLVRLHRPWVQPLLGVHAGGRTFEALVVNSTRSCPLRHVRQRLRQWHQLPEEPFRPHASLVYGAAGDPAFSACATELAQRPWPKWTICALELWAIQGPAPTWRLVHRAALRTG